MRILITAQGSQFIDDLETNTNSNKLIHFQTHSNTRAFRGLSQTHLGRTNTQTSKTLYSHNATNSFSKPRHRKFKSNVNDLDNLNIKDPQYKQAKHVKIRMPRIAFPKSFVEKYEKDSGQQQNIITTTGNFLPSLNSNQNTLTTYGNDENSSMNINLGSKMFSFREIIPNETITKLKQSILKRNELKAKQCRITENDFRTAYEAQTDLEKFDDILGIPKVTSTKLSLIRYLNERKNLNPTTIKTLYECNPERINRVNKMCQILLHDGENKKVLNDFIQKKLKEKANDTKMEFKHKIEEMKYEVDGIKSYLKKYKGRIDEREKFKDIHKELVMTYWNKYDFDRFNKKKDRKTKSNDFRNSEDENNFFTENI